MNTFFKLKNTWLTFKPLQSVGLVEEFKSYSDILQFKDNTNNNTQRYNNHQ